uniref:GYF domain-containing protein n=1 Tax=Arcella intermedia TaxID=1963864 RepID=A0A6B2LCR2_9EUKA
MGESNPTEEDVENLFQQGVNLEAFNMKEELAEGVVDVDSGAVNPRKARELPDEAWLVEFDEHMKDRQYAHRHNRYSKSRGEQSNEAPTAEEVDKIQLLNEIANTLLWGEKVDTAMRRLRPNGKKPRPKPLPTGDPSDPPPPPPLTFNEFLERLDKVVGAGVTSIYSMTKEEVLDLLDEETNPKSPEADKENVPGKADADGLSWGVTPTLWDYKWSDRTDQTVYGPHTSIEMDSWIKQGYFDESVLCRQTGTQDEFRNIKEVDFSLYN